MLFKVITASTLPIRDAGPQAGEKPLLEGFYSHLSASREYIGAQGLRQSSDMRHGVLTEQGRLPPHLHPQPAGTEQVSAINSASHLYPGVLMYNFY